MNIPDQKNDSGDCTGQSDAEGAPIGVAVNEVLIELGFREEWGVIADRQPGYNYDFGDFILSAKELMSLYLQPEMSFSGLQIGSNSLRSIDFQMPLIAESREQICAWIAYGLGQGHLPKDCPDWLLEGYACKHVLPWERAAARYAGRPRCSVARAWMRLAAAKLRQLGEKAGPGDSCEVSFDGTVLKFHAAGVTVPLPADGEAWPEVFQLELSHLAGVPKRFMQDPVFVDVFKGHVGIGRHQYPLINP